MPPNGCSLLSACLRIDIFEFRHAVLLGLTPVRFGIESEQFHELSLNGCRCRMQLRFVALIGYQAMTDDWLHHVDHAAGRWMAAGSFFWIQG